MTSFALDLQRFAQKAADRADAVVREVVGAITVKLDERSPVGNPLLWKNPPPKGYVGGHFRGNWQLGVGTIPQGEVPGVDPNGVRAKAIVAAIPTEAAGKVFWLANNVPYARALEEGHSGQQPLGIVGRTAVEFQQIVDEAVAKSGGGA